MISLSKNHFMKQWKEVTDKAKQKQKIKPNLFVLHACKQEFLLFCFQTFQLFRLGRNCTMVDLHIFQLFYFSSSCRIRENTPHPTLVSLSPLFVVSHAWGAEQGKIDRQREGRS